MRKVIFICFLFLLKTTQNLLGQDFSNTDYIEKYQHIAKQVYAQHGIPVSICLGQGILESGSGNSNLAQKSNNHFGMKKGKTWQGSVFYYADDDKDKNGNIIPSAFRVYPDPSFSFLDYANNLARSQRYKHLFATPNYNYKAWANGLYRAGYASSPDYAKTLIAIIERNNLQKLEYLPDFGPIVESRRKFLKVYFGGPVDVLRDKPKAQKSDSKDGQKEKPEAIKNFACFISRQGLAELEEQSI